MDVFIVYQHKGVIIYDILNVYTELEDAKQAVAKRKKDFPVANFNYTVRCLLPKSTSKENV